MAVEQRPAETLGTLAMMAATAGVGTDDPAALIAKALEALTLFEGRTVGLSDDDRRIARATVLARVWQGFGVDGVGPDRYAGRAWWLARFREAGWVHLWGRGPRPSSAFGPVRLFRGAVLGRREGLAWTSSRELAGWFAGRAGAAGVVWSALVPSGRVVMAFPIWVPGVELEAATEFIVDVDGLLVERAAG